MSSKDILLKELSHWPGVEFSIENGGRHRKLRISYRETSRFITFSDTKVDPRGMLNQRAKLRHMLMELGAERQ